MNDIWSKNIKILSQQNRDLAARLEREPANYAIESIACHNGDLTLKVNGVTLHSRYDPRGEARKMIEEFVTRHHAAFEKGHSPTPPRIVVFGFGMGYHVEELLTRLQESKWHHDPARVVVIEPRYAVLRAAMESRDLSGIISRISILAGPNPEVLLAQDNSPFLLYVHSPYRKLNHEILAKVESQQSMGISPASRKNRLKILAISPIYGGSVPTLLYSADALKDLGHKVEILDNTPYYNILMGIEHVTRNESHRNSLRGLLTTYLAECAVAKALDIKADMVFGVAQSPMTPDGLQELRSLKIPSAFWFVEDRFLFPYWKEFAPLYDHFFVIQQGEFLEELKSMGVRNAHYLPCAAHPPVHHPVSITLPEQEIYGSDISFMGAGYYNRHQMFMKLLDFDFRIWGQDWNMASPLGRIVQKKSERINPDEYIKVFGTSKINLNLHSSPTHEGVNPHGDFVNPRTFELAACQAFQLVDHRSLLPSLFDVGKEMITFRDINDLRDKIRHYLDHPEERKEIAQSAYQRALSEHTYAHRMEAMLDNIVAQEPVLLTAKAVPNSPKVLIEQAGSETELGQFLAKFADEDELTLDRISKEIRKGKGELTHTEGIFLLMKEFQDWAREKGVIGV